MATFFEKAPLDVRPAGLSVAEVEHRWLVEVLPEYSSSVFKPSPVTLVGVPHNKLGCQKNPLGHDALPKTFRRFRDVSGQKRFEKLVIVVPEKPVGHVVCRVTGDDVIPIDDRNETIVLHQQIIGSEVPVAQSC